MHWFTGTLERHPGMLVSQKRYMRFLHNAVPEALSYLRAYSWDDPTSALFSCLQGPFCSPQTLCFLTPSTTSALNCWSLSPSFIILTLKLFLSGWTVCWQRYFFPLGHMDLVPSKLLLIFSEGPMVIEAKTCCLHQLYKQLLTCRIDLLLLKPFHLTGRIKGNTTRAPMPLIIAPLSHVVTLDMLQVSLSSTISAPMEELGGSSLRTAKDLAASLQWTGS